jgi:hypothetical protein
MQHPWQMKTAYKILVGKPEGKRPLARPRRRWEDNIIMNLRETGWEGVDWMRMAQEREQLLAVVNTVMKFWISQNAENFLTS